MRKGKTEHEFTKITEFDTALRKLAKVPKEKVEQAEREEKKTRKGKR